MLITCAFKVLVLNRLVFPQETSVWFKNFQRALVQNKVIKFQNSFKTARWGGDAHRKVQADMDLLWKWNSRRNSFDNYLLKP